MIRINLLGQKPPRPARRAVAAGVGATLILLLASVVVAFGVLWYIHRDKDNQLQETLKKEELLKRERAELQNLERQLIQFQTEKDTLQRQIDVIKALDRNRTGGQELLTSLAGTVIRTDGLWLTGLSRKGNSLTLEGTAGSVKAVADFITQLRRSGYFDRVEIKEAKQDERNTAVAIFLFSLTADFTLPTGPSGSGAGTAPRS